MDLCCDLALLVYAVSGYALQFEIVRPYYEMFQALGAELPNLTILLLNIGDPILGIIALSLSCAPVLVCLAVPSARLKFVLSGVLLLLIIIVLAAIKLGLELPIKEAQAALS